MATSNSNRYKMSQERLEELKQELNYMETVREKEVSEQIKEARSFGDLSENSEYDEAKTEQGKLYSKIAEYKDLIEHAEIVDNVDLNLPKDAVTLGSVVVVKDLDEDFEDKYEIVGSQEANPREGRISDDSPVGKGLIGLLQIRRDKLTALQEEGRDPFKETRFDRTAMSVQIKNAFEEYENKQVAIAGRIMSKRGMGKAIFCHIQDREGQIQLYIRKDAVSETEFADFRKYDVGDIIGVNGYVFKTQTGEITVHVEHVKLLSKSLRPLPEKYHGMTNTDLRYRQRYTDLIMNENVRDTFIKRSRIISSIRRYLDAQGFLEVETPMLVQNAGGAAARPFLTHFNALDQDLKLRISLELYLKRLIVGGLEKVYEIGRVFRNEGMDTRHNPEFTLMELYQAYTDFHGMMDLTENLYRHVAQEVLGTTVVVYNGVEIDLGKPFARMTMTDAVKQYSSVDFHEIHTLEEARAAAQAHGVEYEDRHQVGDILNLFFDAFVEEHLIQPTFLTEHPVEISPLTKRKPDDPDHVERFELFINGWEMANAYSELNDPIDQRERFKAQEEQLAKGDEEANTTDEDFLNALEIGMPPTGGIGYGIDRLCMLLTDSAAIRDVLLFPTMKPEN